MHINLFMHIDLHIKTLIIIKNLFNLFSLLFKRSFVIK